MSNSLKTICFDIDGTICSIDLDDYSNAQPFEETIKKINVLYDLGHKIIFNTARGFLSGKDWEKTTKDQLKVWGVKYHELYFNKPAADYYIDDKALELKNWEDILIK